MKNTVIQGDCLEVMKDIPDKSIDLVLCDLPYGITACKWDSEIPLEPLWKQYKRVIKDNGAIVLTASQPFTSKLVMSNPDMFKYEWVWEKSHSTGFLNANRIPLRKHENILIFAKVFEKYNPQIKSKDIRNIRPIVTKERTSENYGEFKSGNTRTIDVCETYPNTIIKFNRELPRVHPTQKPVALFEYLIKTYTNEGDTVLDNCAGSGTTGVACKKLNRNYILIEKEPKYVDIINKRLAEPVDQYMF